jgi:hypothetical protein
LWSRMMRSLPSLRVLCCVAVATALSPSLTVSALAQDAAKPPAAVESSPAPALSSLTSAILKRLQDKRLDATSDERRAAVAFYEKASPNALFASGSGLTAMGLAIQRTRHWQGSWRRGVPE